MPGPPSTPSWQPRKASGSSRTTRPRNSQSRQRRQATRRRPMPSRRKAEADAIAAKEKADGRGQGEGQGAPAPRRGQDQGTDQDQGRHAGVPGHGAVGACRRRRSSIEATHRGRRQSHRREGPALESRCSIRPRSTPCGSGSYTPTLLNGMPVPVHDDRHRSTSSWNAARRSDSSAIPRRRLCCLCVTRAPPTEAPATCGRIAAGDDPLQAIGTRGQR